MSDFFEVNCESSFMQEDNYSGLEGQQIRLLNIIINNFKTNN